MKAAHIRQIVAVTALVVIGVVGAGPVGATALFQTFDSLALGDLSGQAGWTGSPEFDVIAGTSPVSAPNNVQIIDNSSSAFSISHLNDELNRGSFAFSARHLTNNLSNNSGLFLRMDATVAGSASPDPFFQVGLSPAMDGIAWTTYGGGADGAVSGIVNNGEWYKFVVDWNITSAATHYVNLSVTNLTAATSVLNTNLTMVGNQGARHYFGRWAFETGSSHLYSTFELDDVGPLVPEPSVTALLAVASVVVWRRRRK